MRRFRAWLRVEGGGAGGWRRAMLMLGRGVGAKRTARIGAALLGQGRRVTLTWVGPSYRDPTFRAVKRAGRRWARPRAGCHRTLHLQTSLLLYTYS